MPFPSTQAIHPDWASHHQPTAESRLTGRLVVQAPSTGGGWDPETGPYPGTPGEVYYDGPFHAQAVQDIGGPTADAVGQEITIRAYLLALRANAPVPPVGTRATVIACPGDAELVGKVFTITGPVLGSRRFERDLYADLDISNQPDSGEV